jgi:ADP-ribose pyrophosphatase YjhB (NUDIX family)
MSDASPHRPAGAEPTPGVRYPLVTVGALIEGPSGRLLFIRTHKWGDRWGVPGGKVDWGESLLEAVHREVREETGLEVEDVRWAPVQEAVLHPEFHRPAHFVLVNVLARSRGERVTLNDEAQAFTWCTADEAERLELNEPTRRLVAYHRAHAADAPPLEQPPLRGAGAGAEP